MKTAMITIASLAPCLALAACNKADDSATEADTGTASAPSTAAPEGQASPPRHAPVDPAMVSPTGAPDDLDGERSEARSNEFSSAYTAFDFDKCTVTYRATEGQSIDYKCPGMRGIPLYLHDGDGRYDLDVGVSNDRFESIGAFNSIGTTIEWRMREGSPFAVIFRLYDATSEDRGRSVLAIEKRGTARSPGCRVAQVAGSTPDANRRAREIADRAATGFSCGTETMQVVGAR